MSDWVDHIIDEAKAVQKVLWAADEMANTLDAYLNGEEPSRGPLIAHLRDYKLTVKAQS